MRIQVINVVIAKLIVTVAFSTGHMYSFFDDQSLTLFHNQQLAIQAGAQAEKRNDLRTAEEEYLKAIRLAKALPSGAYHVQTDAMRTLANLYGKQKRTANAEALLQERLAILQDNQSGVDLDLGVALLDLEGFYGATGQDKRGEEFGDRAIRFYTGCMRVQKLHEACNYLLAEAEGMQGQMFFNRKLYDRAEPWLRKVIERPDNGARPELMIPCLIAYSVILQQRGFADVANATMARAEHLRNQHPNTR